MLVFLRRIRKRTPRQNAQLPASVGSHTLGESERLQHLRYVGRSRRIQRARRHVGRLPVQAWFSRDGCASHRRVGLRTERLDVSRLYTIPAAHPQPDAQTSLIYAPSSRRKVTRLIGVNIEIRAARRTVPLA